MNDNYIVDWIGFEIESYNTNDDVDIDNDNDNDNDNDEIKPYYF
jgi:hypothetical protein